MLPPSSPLSPLQTLTLNRPGRLNAFSNDSYRLLGTHLNDAAKDAGVKCVVLTGAGPFHSSGAWVAQCFLPVLWHDFGTLLLLVLVVGSKPHIRE